MSIPAQPVHCCIVVKTIDRRVVSDNRVLLRTSFHEREFSPLRYWVDVTMHTPCGPQTWPVDIRDFPLDPEVDECPVCVLAAWVDQNSQKDLISLIAKQSKIRRV
jgi:hypothetical protein